MTAAYQQRQSALEQLLKCSHPGCRRAATDPPYCHKHAARKATAAKRQQTPPAERCAWAACNRPVRYASFCERHLQDDYAQGTAPKLSEHGYILTKTGRLLHRDVAEAALGKHLPPRAVVHHVNQIKTDNRPENLVICPDNDYHAVIHQRTRAYEVTGHASWQFCWRCRNWSPPERMTVRADGAPVHKRAFCLPRKRHASLPWNAHNKDLYPWTH